MQVKTLLSMPQGILIALVDGDCGIKVLSLLAKIVLKFKREDSGIRRNHWAFNVGTDTATDLTIEEVPV
jgi:hypothetical protein